MRITDQLEHAGETIVRNVTALPTALYAIRDAMVGQPGAQAFEGTRTSGHATVLDDEGIPMPAVADPTGEAGVRRAMGKDVAANDLRHLREIAARIHRDSELMADIIGAYLNRAPSTRQRATVEQANAHKAPEECEHCRNTAHTFSPLYVRDSTVKGNLERGHALCRWCYDWTIKHGELPPERHLRTYHQRGYVRVAG